MTPEELEAQRLEQEAANQSAFESEMDEMDVTDSVNLFDESDDEATEDEEVEADEEAEAVVEETAEEEVEVEVAEEEEEEVEEEEEDDDVVVVEEEEEAEPDDKDAIIANLRKRLGTQTSSAQSAPATPVVEKPDATPAAEVTPVEITDTVFATEANFDELLRNPDSFNKALNAGIKEALTQVSKANQQQALEMLQVNLPGIVRTQVTAQRSDQQAADAFYEKHTILAEFKPLVGQNVTQVAAENPEWELAKVTEEAAKRTYNQLELAQAAGATTTKGKKPVSKAKNTGLRKSGGSRGKTKRGRLAKNINTSKLQGELDEMNR